MFDFIKIKIKNSRLLGGVYRSLSQKYHDCKKSHAVKRIQKKGCELVKFITSFASKNNYDIFFDMGTLLGIVRENSFIKHDLDVDVGLFCDSEKTKNEIIKSLKKEGAKLKYVFEMGGSTIVESSFTYKGIKFDINFYNNDGSDSVCYLMFRDPERRYENNEFDIVELRCNKIKPVQNVIFCNCIVQVPDNPKAYLSERYGPNWMIPDKNYIYWKGPTARWLKNVKGKRIVF